MNIHKNKIKKSQLLYKIYESINSDGLRLRSQNKNEVSAGIMVPEILALFH